jgi:hypothetical protein
VTAAELVELSDLLHDTDDDVRGSAYSHWCTCNGELIGDDAAAQAAGLVDA